MSAEEPRETDYSLERIAESLERIADNLERFVIDHSSPHYPTFMKVLSKKDDPVH